MGEVFVFVDVLGMFPRGSELAYIRDPRELEHGLAPLYEREELIRIVAEAIPSDLAARETRVTQERAAGSGQHLPTGGVV